DIAYWQPADSLAILKLVALGSTAQLRAEVLRAQVSLAIPERAADLVTGEGEPPMPAYAALFGPDARFPGRAAVMPAPDWFSGLAGFVVPGLGTTANGFAADGARTATGAPLLANDPHVALTAPSLWYLARMDLRAGGVIGGTIPGIPAILSGRNPMLAWGMTPAWMDDQDIVMEEVQPGDPDRYLGPQGWTDFTTRQETIRVQGGPEQQVTLRESGAGPVIPGLHFGLGAVTPAGSVAALRWTGLSTQDTTMSALVGLMSAQDRAAGLSASRAIVAPSVELTLADAEGVAQTLAGAVPLRPSDHPTAGRMPAPGRDRAVRWDGLLPPDAPARQAAPDRGIVAATGGGRPDGIIPASVEEPTEPAPLPVAGGPAALPAAPSAALSTAAPFLPGYDRDDPLRLERLDRLLAGREVHSRDSFIDAQLDTVSTAARALLPVVGADLWFTDEPAAPGTAERQRQDAPALLAEWNGNMGEHLPEPLVHAAWMAQLQDRLIRDELGGLADSHGIPLRPAFIERVFRDIGGAAVWCDVVQSAPVEDCETIARQALDAALLDLTARFGPDVASWRWGDRHEARHEHPGLGRMPVVNWVVSLVQSTSGDGSSLARAATRDRMDVANPWANVVGAGYRGVYDLADPDSSVFVISTGQSGHPLSRHYDDLSGLWRRGEYVVMSLDPELARAGAEGVTRLLPAPE
ncbi:MAG TPA: penicillin acylase family protein, partial [Paracoccus sp. (in: a-proteobacteria)]|nr:penicillin acylase family protein [Paracoccus sp. (in: a-proteobacteria)]